LVVVAPGIGSVTPVGFQSVHTTDVRHGHKRKQTPSLIQRYREAG